MAVEAIEQTSDGLDIEIDSVECGVSVKFSRPLSFFILSSSDARNLAQHILDKVEEAEMVGVEEAPDWLAGPLDLELTMNLKRLLDAALLVQATRGRPSGWRALIETLTPSLREPGLLSAIGEAIWFEVKDGECGGDVRQRLTTGDDRCKRAVDLLNWIALLPTVPPPKQAPK